MTSIVPRDSTSFTDTLPDSSNEIEAVVREERKQLKASIEQLGNVMKEKVDVRTQFREHPLAAVGVGFVAGIALGVLSNRAGKSSHRSRHSSKTASANNEWMHDAPDHHSAAGGSRSSSSGMGKMAATIMGLVGARVADLAEDTLRESMAKRRFSVPQRKRPVT